MTHEIVVLNNDGFRTHNAELWKTMQWTLSILRKLCVIILKALTLTIAAFVTSLDFHPPYKELGGALKYP